MRHRQTKRLSLKTAANVLALLCGIAAVDAQAGSFKLGESIDADYKLTFNYSLAVRMKNPDPALIDGPIDPFQREFMPGPGRLVGFTHTGLPSTANFDDGDRNFKKYALINNRLTTLGEISFKFGESYGAIFSGSAFYDDVYARNKNDNNSPATVNLYGPNGEFPTANRSNNNEFSSDTKRFDGRRARLLEAYVYGDFELGEMPLDLRLGKQVATYGESLFFAGVASAQGPFDATKAFVAGSEIKDIILPIAQVAARLGVTEKFTALGEYQLDYQPTDIFPQGDYFSPADIVGPGSVFAYGSANPMAGDCTGLLSFGNASLDSLCALLKPLAGSTKPGDPIYVLPSIIVTRDKDLLPSKYGQYGLGLRYAVTSTTTLGLYRLRYHDHNPTVQLNPGFGLIAVINVPGLPPMNLDTSIINQPVPVTYNIKYFDGIDMNAVSYSTVVGVFNVAGEFSYRRGLPIPVQAKISGVVSPVYTRGNLSMAQVSAIYTANPNFIMDDVILVGEAGVIHVNSVTPVPDSAGIDTVGDGNTLFYNKTSWAFQMIGFSTKRNIIAGWDFTIPFSAGMIVSGDPSMSGAFAALYGEGDIRASLGAKMTRLQNLELGLNYNLFFGNSNKTVKDSPIKANPYADRDYATLNVKYNF